MKKLFYAGIGGFVLIVGLAAIGFWHMEKGNEPIPTPVVQEAPQIKFTIIEGWTLDDIAQRLENDPKQTNPHIADASEFLSAAGSFDISDYPLLASKPKNASLEGFIFPDTYFIPETAPTSTTMSAIVIEKALNNFSKKFTPEMVAQAQKGNMSIYEIVTLASIVEKETGRNVVTDEQKAALQQERKIVAGIFYNRLNIGMALQSDATVNYITKKNTPSASNNDIAIDSPYNTYKYAGLPPGPIGNPSLSSLMAVLYPEKTDYLYFLHKQPSGEAVYSKTFEEHVQNKQKYLK